jgi:uncharacterized protein YkwD
MKTFVRPAAAGLLASAALAAGPTPAAPLAGAAAPTLRVSAVNTDYERAVLSRVNRVRARHGLPALRASSCLDVFAERRARRLAAERILVHFGLGAVFDRCGGSMMGENLARGRYLTATRVVEAWLRSPGHRANVLRSGFRSAAVGAWRASDGTIYVSMVYRAP